MNEFSKLWESSLRQKLDRALPRHVAKDPYIYSLFPAGKLFRPKLVWAQAMDFNHEFSPEHLAFSHFVEMFHVYTLIHDDLPAMDNDDERRGRLANHKKFGEWQAILTGDGLQTLSFSLLADLPANNLPHILKLVTWALGPKGLIHGQYLDLSEEMNNGTQELLETHLLKTARLIQTSLVGPALLNKKQSSALNWELFRFGRDLGIAFQLLDDLAELVAPMGKHELSVNPWPTQAPKISQILSIHLERIRHFQKKHRPKHLEEVLDQYFLKMQTAIKDGRSVIENVLGDKCDESLRPIMSFL